MYSSIFLAALIGISNVAGLENPHKRAPSKFNAPAPNTRRAASNHGKRSYLNANTSSETG